MDDESMEGRVVPKLSFKRRFGGSASSPRSGPMESPRRLSSREPLPVLTLGALTSPTRDTPSLMGVPTLSSSALKARRKSAFSSLTAASCTVSESARLTVAVPAHTLFAHIAGEAGNSPSALAVTRSLPLDPHEKDRFETANESDDGACECTREEICRYDRGVDYSRFSAHTLARACDLCQRAPATFLSLSSLKAYCPGHVQRAFEADPTAALFVCLADLTTSFDRVFWCERCRRFTWKYTDVYEPLTDQLVYTRGVYLPEPVRDVVACVASLAAPCCAPSTLRAVVASTQGWRAAQEDAEAVFDLDLPPSVAGGSMAVFCVFDGHGGDAVAKLCGRFIEGELRVALHEADSGCDLAAYFDDVFGRTLRALDARIRGTQDGRRGLYALVGSTACIVGITADGHIVCANVGDSGAVLFFEDGAFTSLSTAHRIGDDDEATRIQAAGHTIRDHRIDGLLGVPRALGDYQFKGPQPAVVAEPTVTLRRVPAGSAWHVVVACDGLWDTLPTHDVAACIAPPPVPSALDGEALPPGMSAAAIGPVLAMLARSVATASSETGLGVDNVSIIDITPVSAS